MFLWLTFKDFEEKGEAWIINSDISDDEFNNLKNVAKETGGDGSLLFWIRLYGEIVDYALTFKIVDDTLETVDSLQELIQRSSEEGNVFVLPEDERLTEGNNGDVLTFPAEEFTVPTGTPGFELGEPIGFDDNTFFPKGDGFLDDLLNGRFETPNESEGGSYFLAIEVPDNPIGKTTRLDKKFLEERGIDAEELKKGVVGDAGGRFDIYKDQEGNLWAVEKKQSPEESDLWLDNLDNY